MLKLTQCLIVKNEEKNLPRALKWGKGLADEQIVVDTGSSDATAALAEKLGAKVVRFQWTKDFSAARNFAISHCTGDWILFLDADEYFREQDLPLLRPLLEEVDRKTVLRNGRSVRYNVIETPWVNAADQTAARQARIFRNDSCLRYEGAIHEQLHALPGGRLTVYAVKEVPAIYHTGYLWGENGEKAAKAARNLEVIVHALEQSPGCAKLQLYAAEALLFAGKPAEAEEYFAKGMENRDGSISPERLRTGYAQWLGLYLQKAGAQAPGEWIPSAERVYSAAVAEFPDEPNYDLLLCQLALKTGSAARAVRAFASALSKDRDGRVAKLLEACDPDALKAMREAAEHLKK
jgi:glycosyltransferase involved in cell wall biosynthesis